MKVNELLEGKGAFTDALGVACPLCKAKPGDGCVSIKDGAKCSTWHNERLRAAGHGSGRPTEISVK